MRAVVLRDHGGPEVLQIEDVPDPVAGPDQIVVDVAHTALNRADTLQRMGMYADPRGREIEIPGLEARGIHRAECLSIEGHDEAHRWLRWLGARREASLPLRGRDGETFHLYAWCVPAVLDRCRRAGDITRSTGSGHRPPLHSSDRKD